MKKLNKLFAILIAVLGVGTLSAQTNIIANWDGGSNTGVPTSFGWASSNSGRSWGELNGGGARVTNNYSGYTLENGSSYSYNANSELSSKILWIRYANTSETYTYTFTGLEAGKVYTFSGLVGWHNNSNAPTFTITVNGDKELAKVSKYCGTKQALRPFSVDFMVPADNQSTNFTLTFKSNQGNDNMEALSALSIVENTAIANASEANPYDMTSWLQDPGFEDASGGSGTVNIPPGWSMKYTLSGWLDGSPNTTNPSEGSKCYNLWAGTFTSVDMYQTVTLPAGKYTVMADLRTEFQSQITNQGVYASVGGVITKSGTITNVAATWNSKEGWNTLSATFNNPSTGEVIIGISSTGNGGSNGWFQADNVRLMYYGYDLSEALNALNALVATAQGIIDANEVSPQSVLSLQAAIEAANSVQQTEEAIAEASTALTEVINAANATVAACNEYRATLALSESMYTNSTADDKSTFEAAINKAKSDFNVAANVDAISAIVTDLQNAQKAYCLVATPTEGHPFDMTFLVVNPNFNQDKTGWTSEGGAQNKAIASNKPEPITGKFYENWNPSEFTGSIYQEISGLSNGTYRMKAAAFGNNAVLFANDATIQMADNDNTPAWYEVEVKVSGGTLKFGVKNNNNTGWMGIDNVSLLFISGSDLDEFIASYETALAKATAARDNEDYKNVTGVERTNLENAIGMSVAEQTKAAYLEVTSILESATQAFTSAKADYDVLAGEIDVAKGLGMTDDAINSVTSSKTGALAYTDLKVAEYIYIMGTYTEEAPIGTWTSDFDQIDGQSYDGSNTKYYDKWGDGTFTLKQTVTLPKGNYALSVIARGQSGANGTLYYKIGDATTSTNLIMKGDAGLGVDVNGVANFSAEGSYSNNNAGRGWEYRFITFQLDAETQVEIGVSATVNWKWASIYAPKLYTDLATKKAVLLTEIENLLAEVPSGYMNAEVESTLNTTKEAAQVASSENTMEQLNEIYAAFKDAVDAAKASIAAYEKLERYISMTAVFTDVTAYEQKYDNRLFTTDEVESVRQELNVLRYNAASAMYTNKVDVTGWTGTMGERSNEHWSGTTVAYKDANSWNDIEPDALTTQITLTKGNYVLKVAGRCSPENATLTLKVLDQTITFHGKGATGKGIDTSGAANFSDGTYANNNNGFGWEWEFLRFSLDAEQTVTLEVNSNYNNTWQVWNSFGDITLWMDDETYINVNGHAIDAPLATAEALVDTKPMGADQNNALKAAIAQAKGTISTPEQLNGAVDALNTAVANAKAWVAAYNEAKAPLVAELERFEADYNKDGVKMSKGDWENVLDKVKAAAVAKDVTDSYDGFAVAAEELNAALDAAQASINAYAALNEAIVQAETLASANVGDQPFQRSADAINGLGIADAKATYTAATADSEEVTFVTETLKAAINSIVLNAPAEGQRFYIKVATEGHGKLGNALLATLGNTSANNPTGYGLNTDNAARGYLAQAFIFTQVEGNLYNISIERPEGTVYLTYGSLNGSAAGWNKQQIQATTNAENKGEFKIEATAKEGVLKIFNTVDNNYIDCQGGGAIYTDTGIENEEFAFELASEHEVTLTITDAEWSTLMLPFDAVLPEGVVAYSCEKIAEDGVSLALVEAESLKANTPYLVKGKAGEHKFAGYGLADKDSYTVGLFTGTYVDYKTTANSNTYVLQKNDNNVAFYLVGDGAQPWVRAYHCYMTYDNAAGAPMFSISRGEDTTGIENSTLNAPSTVIYDLMGRKVTTMVKGGMYIVNGKKVVVK